MFKTNVPKKFPNRTVSENTVKGVREAYLQSCAEKPAEATVLPRLTLADFPASKTVYVAPNGADTATGTKEAPYATLARALKDVEGGGTVMVADGIYEIAETVKIGEENGGKKGAPLFITAEEGANPRFTSGKIVPNEALVRADDANFLTAHDLERLNRFNPENSKNVWAVDLGALGFTLADFDPYRSGEVDPCLLIDDKNYVVARFPNKGITDEEDVIRNGAYRTVTEPLPGNPHIKKVGNVRGGISNLFYEHRYEEGGWEIWIDDACYLDHVLGYDTEAGRLWMYGAVYEEWDRRRYALTIGEENGRYFMKSALPAFYGAKENKGNRLFFYNMLEDLDEEDEYLIDPDRLILYIYAKDSLDGKTITVATADFTLVEMENAAYTVIDGLTFFRSSGHAVTLKECDNVVVQGCTFDGINKRCVMITDCSNCALTYCDLVRSYGVIMTGEKWTADLTASANFVQNNKFRNAGEVAARQNGIHFGGVGDVISHNYFYETTLYVGHAYESLVEYNELDRGSQHVRDNGPIYTNDNSRGLHIRYNYLHNMNYALYGIYLDDFSSGLYVYGNVIHYVEGVTSSKCVNLHNGIMNVVENNVCINAVNAGILNNSNYYAKTINGIPQPGGGLGYRWESIAKDRLTRNYHKTTDEAMRGRYPLYGWFIDIVDQSIEIMNANPNWDPSHKRSPEEDIELFTRKPGFNIYEKNVFYNCVKGLEVPCIGSETCIAADNASYALGTDIGFVDEANGNFDLKADSCVFADIPGFVRPPYEKFGLTE